MVSVISAWTVAWPPGLFHKMEMSNAANRRALSWGGRPGRMSPARGSWSSSAGVGGGRCGLGQGLELGFEAFAFLVEFGEPGADAGPVGLGGRVVGVGGVGGEFFQFQDLGVLRGFDPGDPGRERGVLGVPVGGGRRVGGGELGREQGGAAGAEDPVGEEPADDLVQEQFGGLDGAGVVGMVGGVLGAGPVMRAPVIATTTRWACRRCSRPSAGGSGRPDQTPGLCRRTRNHDHWAARRGSGGTLESGGLGERRGLARDLSWPGLSRGALPPLARRRCPLPRVGRPRDNPRRHGQRIKYGFGDDPDDALSLRRLLVDIIEEYARHTGHAELISETIDGLVGEDPPGAVYPYEPAARA